MWSRDPQYRGLYSFVAVTVLQNACERRQLALPIMQSVYFVGGENRDVCITLCHDINNKIAE